MPWKWNGSTHVWVEPSGGKKKKGKATSLNREVATLQATVGAQEKNVERMGGKVQKGGPSILSRVFDVISRPNYAVAEGFKQLGNDKNKGLSRITAALGGTSQGIQGKKKTTFSNVLAQEGVKGPVGAVAGFALDVGLDPTTYLGIGVPGKLAKTRKIAAEVKGARAFSTAIKSKAAEKAAAHAVVDTVSKGGASSKAIAEIGDDLVDETLKKKMTKAAVQAKTNIALTKAKDVETAALAADRNKISLKFLGKPIASSEKLYRGLARVGDPIAKTGTGQIINKAFRTSSYFPGDTNRMRRMFEGMGVANYEKVVEETIKPLFSGLTKSEKSEISHAIERQHDLTGRLSASGVDLGEVQKRVKAINDDLFDEEAHVLKLFDKELKDKKTGKSLLNGDPVHDYAVREAKRHNAYVYHHYKSRKGDYKTFKSGRRAVGTEQFGSAKARQIPTLADAKRTGLNPVESMEDIISLRVAKNHKVRARVAFVNAIEKEYGIKLTPKQARHMPNLVKGESEFLPNGVYFPKEVAKVLGNIEAFHTNEELASRLLNTFDKAQGFWKFGATAVNPGHHFRNGIGDVFLNYEDGVVNPMRYWQSARVMQKQAKTKVGKLTLPAEDILREFRFTGGKSGYYKNEMAADTMMSGIGKGIKNVAETREDFTRLAHFIDAIKKEGKNVNDLKSLREAAERASARVNKYNIDYGDLTPFERNAMKRAIPFYTFIRKNIPLQIETLALEPGKLAVVPKINRNIEALLGTDQETSDAGYVIPKWIREMSGIRIRGEGEGKNALYWAPALPVGDISRFAEGNPQEIMAGVMSSLSPAVRIPAELAAGKKFFSGAPIGSYPEYFSEQLPASRVATSSLNPEKRSMQKILNYLTGAGMYEVTPELQKSELRRQQQPLKSTVKKRKEKLENR